MSRVLGRIFVASLARRRLASLGYVASESIPSAVPPGAPRAADMTRIFGALDRASRAFADGDYARAAPLLAEVVRADPGNLMSSVRLGVAQSLLGRDREAEAAFGLIATVALDTASLEDWLNLLGEGDRVRRGRRQLVSLALGEGGEARG